MAELLDFTKPHILRNEAEYSAAVEEIDRLLDADPPRGSEDHERLEFLSVLVEAYEETHHPIEDLATPQDIVELMIEQKGLSKAEVQGWLGGRDSTDDFLNGERLLSLQEIHVLRDRLGIPADLLMGEPVTKLRASL